MTVALIVLVAIVAVAVGYTIGRRLRRPGRRLREPAATERRILLPFTGRAISQRAFEAAVRLARAENATIMPAFLARVPRTLPLDAPLPKACAFGMPVLEAFEQGARAQGVAVDSRISRGRTYRDALQRLLDEEHFDRIIVSVSADPRNGLSRDDLDWLIERAPAEVIILRPREPVTA